MKNAGLFAGEVITSLGFSTAEHVSAIASGITGIRGFNDPSYSPFSFHASLIDPDSINSRFGAIGNIQGYTRLEKMMILSLKYSMENLSFDCTGPDTLLIITTTKGNIDVLEEKYKSVFPGTRAYLGALGKTLKDFFGFNHDPLVVCNACISGVMGIIIGSRMIRRGMFKNVLVCGGDLVSAFTVAGFQSFKAIGTTPCKPYDASRDGLSLGEGAGTVLLTDSMEKRGSHSPVRVLGGSVSNDANHISGPSRDGKGLASAVNLALYESALQPSAIGYISAHGTATPYNDEMECKAFNSCDLQQVPLNSFKGAIGHTLGAAGVIETAIAVESMRQGILLASTGYCTRGVSLPLQVIEKTAFRVINSILKTASGFGGSNAALVISR